MASANYSSSALVSGLHGLPHYDLSFRKVSNEFRYEDADYQQSLIQFAVPWILAAVLAMVGLKCASKTKAKAAYARIDDDESDPSKKWSTYLRVAAVLIILMAPVQYYANEEITVGLGRFGDRLRATQQIYDDLIDSAKATNSSIGDVAVEVENTDFQGQDVTALTASLKRASTEIEKVVGFESALEVGQYADDIIEYDRARWEIMLGFAAVLFGAAVLAYLGRKSGQKTACCLDAVIAFVGLVVTGAYMAMAVGFADFCSDPNLAIVDLVGDSGALAEAAAFYVNCNPGTSSPFLGNIGDTLGFLNATIVDVKGFGEQGVNVSTILDGLDAVNASTATLLEAASCEALHNEYVGSIQAICGPTLEGFLAVLVAVAVSSLAIVLACIALVKLKQYSNQETTSPIKRQGGRGYSSRRGKKGGEYDPLVSETYFGPA